MSQFSVFVSGSPPIGLGLELGRGSGDMLGCTKSCGFTFLQLQELEHQALIYKYMEAGLPVPYHLVYPIWKSVACSLGGLTAGAYQHHPGCKCLELLFGFCLWVSFAVQFLVPI